MGQDWCPDCRRTKRALERLGVSFRWVDVGEDSEALRVVLERNGGRMVIPTVLLPNGSHLSEPTDAELEKALRDAGVLGRPGSGDPGAAPEV